MSVLIKDEKLPKSCGNCFYDTRCDKWRSRNWGAPPPYDCPLVEIPPHGRLIDADALMERFDKEMISCDEHGREFSFSFMRGSEYCAEWWVVEQFLWDAETVIPAEEES